jgi:hypothetical protein
MTTGSGTAADAFLSLSCDAALASGLAVRIAASNDALKTGLFRISIMIEVLLLRDLRLGSCSGNAPRRNAAAAGAQRVAPTFSVVL